MQSYDNAATLQSSRDAIEVRAPSSWLTLSVIGADPEGKVPEGFSAQATFAWANVIDALQAAGYDANDLVKVTQYLTEVGDIAASEEIRARALGETRAASLLLVVSHVAAPGVRIAIEAVAARGPHPHKGAEQLAREAAATSDLGHRDSDEEEAYLRHAEDR